MRDPVGVTGRLALMLPKLSRYGGAERFGWDLAARLAVEGHAVDFVCARAETEPPNGVRVVEVGRPGPFQVVKFAWFLLAAERVRRQGGYDLSISLGKNWNQDVLRVGGGPLGQFWRLSRRAWPQGFPRMWKGVRRRLRPANWLTFLVENRQYRAGGVMVANSHRVRDWILAAYPELDPEKILVIYNRPDLERFTMLPGVTRDELRARAGIREDEIVVVTAATNFALKGVETLIRALPLLPGEYSLRVAGGRNPARYLALARTLGVEGRVRFLGRVEDMPALYNMADVFALPTRYDACSNAVLEALACGLPAVSSRDNGSSRFLPPDAVLDDPLDWSELAARIKAAARGGRQPFTWPEDAPCGLEPYVELVREILARSPANRLLTDCFQHIIEVADGLFQAFPKLHHGFPAEFFPGQGNVRPPAAGVVVGQGLEHDL